MSVLTLLAQLRSLGVELASAREHIRCRAPKGVLTSELRQLLAERRAELLGAPEAAETELASAEAMIRQPLERLLDRCAARDWPAARAFQARVIELNRAVWQPARRRWAKAEYALGRLDPDLVFLLADPDPPTSVWGAAPGGGWRETAEAAAKCLRCHEPRAPGDRLYCEQHRAEPGQDDGGRA